jgi:hypothetical protein
MRSLVLLSLVFLYLTGISQRIRDFNVDDGGNGSVVVRFVLSPGPSCTGFEVMHSTDSMVYKTKHYYDQTCGGSGSPEPFEWTDLSPDLNRMNYYKIQLLSPYETSDIRRLYVAEPGRSRMVVWPNPVFQNADILTMKFFNAGNVKLTGFLYNRFGTPLRDIEIMSHADLASINVGGLGDGLYVLWLTDGASLYSCKFVVKR